MPRFTLRSGVVVNVSDEKAARLGDTLGLPVEDVKPEPKPSAKRSSK